MFSHVVRIYSLVVIIYSHAVRIVMDAVIECFIPWINPFCTPRKEGFSSWHKVVLINLGVPDIAVGK